MPSDKNSADCTVVRNQESRSAFWSAEKPLPAGWSRVFGPSSKTACERWLLQSSQDQESESAPTFDISLMFFGDREDDDPADKYRLVIDCARFADQNGLAAVWIPERHFTRFGCLFPNPAILHAALARETKRIRLRAGSVVLPLNNPLQVAEQWSMVDNLSGGRVDVSVASGWHPDDFVLAPEKYEVRYEAMYRGIELLQRLWRGEAVPQQNGRGETIDVRIYPSPLQPELSLWLTAASSIQTFERAGALGAHLLTHLFDQRIDDLAEKIACYRQARSEHGWNPQTGKVAVTLHAFLDESLEQVRSRAKEPYCRYLKSNAALLKNLALSRGVAVDLSSLEESQVDQLIAFLFEKFVGDRSFLGTPETCLKVSQQLAAIGVDEVACLIDFGLPPEQILENLPHLATLAQNASAIASRD